MDFEQWKGLHTLQLERIPEIYWEALFTKLCTETFDAGDHFIMTPSSQGWRVRVCREEGLKADDSNSVFLVDHSWTYLPDKCYEQLSTIPGLVHRMANLMDLIERPTTPPVESHDQSHPRGSESSEINGIEGSEDEEDEDEEEEEVNPDTPHTSREEEEEESRPPSPPSEDMILQVMNTMWRFNDSYSVSNVPVPVWYILEEFGSRIPHSPDPTVAMVPFFHILTQLSYSILWPLRDLNFGDDLSRNRVPTSADTDLEKACYSLPWSPSEYLSLSDPLWAELDSISPPPMPERCGEQLPDNIPMAPPTPALPYKVYSDVDLVRKNLNHDKFKLVSSIQEADILWMFGHFKDFSSLTPNQFINQFPSENVITCKDLMASVARRAMSGSPDSTPKWLPETFNLFYELPRFVHKFKSLESNCHDNTWIIKPWNLGRGMDIHITRNLIQVIRLSQASPKVACKYITDPVLFHREEIGQVKMDIRYIVLLVSVNPLVLYVYNVFWLRFANKPFSMDGFHDYEKHFTVMNYREETELKHIESHDFIPLFNEQYPLYPWDGIQENIFQMLREFFMASCSEPSPAGICHFPQSRAIYAVDLMLEWTGPDEGCGCQSIQPKLLEVNFSPDCVRACRYHDFYNHMFECLFLPESHHTDDLPVTRLL